MATVGRILQQTGETPSGCKFTYFAQSDFSPNWWISVEDPQLSYYDNGIESYFVNSDIKMDPVTNWKEKPVFAFAINPDNPESCEDQGAKFSNYEGVLSSWSRNEFLPTEASANAIEKGTGEGGQAQSNWSALLANLLDAPPWLPNIPRWLLILAGIYIGKEMIKSGKKEKK